VREEGGTSHPTNPYVIPVTVNGQRWYALRDTGNMALTFVDPSVVAEDAYTGEEIHCEGVFSGQRIPLAIVNLASVALNCNDDVQVRV